MSVHLIDRGEAGRGYKVRWREHGRNRARTFGLKRDAEAFDREIERRRVLGPLAVQQLTGRAGPTLNQWIETQWGPQHAANLEQATRDRYANVYKVHIEPWLGGAPIGELSVSVVRGWQAERVKAGVKPGTIHKARTLLSSVLRHAAESEAIQANPVALVRAPKSGHHDAIQPLSPAVIERIRWHLLHPATREVSASIAGQRGRRRYELPALGTPQTWRRDALIVSLLAYGGLRPGEVRALRLGDVREHTLLVQRAANPDGSVKATKNDRNRSVKLLAALEQEIREYRLAVGRPPDKTLLLVDDHGQPWDKSAWQVWRKDRWRPACEAAGLDPVPRPYDLRHSFASLLLAEGRQPLYVARQLGHSLTVLLTSYAHLIDEYEERPKIDADAEIAKHRETARPRSTAAAYSR